MEIKIMAKRLKLSFLVPAHNEEKIIERTLESLLHLPYENYEVIIGLDGCTDGTEKIVKGYVKKSNKFGYYTLNLRSGKPAVIDAIIKRATGDIIIINDADWIFNVESKDQLMKFLEVFKNPEVGGIADSFPIEWPPNKEGNFTYSMIAYSSFFWMLFQKKRFVSIIGKKGYLKEPTMFLTNIFRKELYEKNFSLGDDFERTYIIMKKRYKIALFDDEHMPKMIASYRNINFKDFFKQKIRTALARKQLVNIAKIFIWNYYLPANLFIFLQGWKRGFYIGLMMSLWIFLTVFATAIARFKKIGTKEGWKLRVQRQ